MNSQELLWRGYNNNYNNNKKKKKNTTGTAEVQKTVLIGTARILRKVLNI